jgi:murein L,D-transpeptidase YafK
MPWDPEHRNYTLGNTVKKTLIILAVSAITVTGVFLVTRPRPHSHAPTPQSTMPRSTPLPRNPASASHLTGIDRVLIEKGARRLSLYRKGDLLKTYRVALGREPVGKKSAEGDCKTPEGFYVIDCRKPNSAFHRALHISYPNAEDRRKAELRGVPPGSDVMIHGLPNGLGAIGSLHLKRDWTLGCIAMTNEEIDELWQAVPNGTVVEIVP